MKSTIFWDITPCSPVIRRNITPPSSGSKNKQARNQRESRWLVALLVTCFQAGFFLDLFFDPEDGGDMFLRGSHSVISQKTVQ
jgi:hypothetical protein